MSKDSVMARCPGDPGRSAATEPSEGNDTRRNDTAGPSWGGLFPPAAPEASRGGYCRDHWPPL